MATTIDELVVVLGLDASQFTEAQKKALADFKKTKDTAQQTANEMSAAGEVAGQFYGKIKSEALSLIAVLVGAKSISQFVGQQVTTLADVSRVATVMGQATPDVIAVGMAVGRIGGNAKEAQNAMLGLSQTMERWSRFGEASLPFRRAAGFIGASVNDTPLQVLQKFATWSQGKRPQDVELVGTDLGLNQDLINEAIRGRKQFDADIAQSYANEPSATQTEEAKNLQGAFVSLQQAAGNAARNLFFAADKAWNFAGIMESLTQLLGGGGSTKDIPNDDNLNADDLESAIADDKNRVKNSRAIAARMHDEGEQALAQGNKYRAAGDPVRASHYYKIAKQAFDRETQENQAATTAANEQARLQAGRGDPTAAIWGPQASADNKASGSDVQQLLAAGFTAEQARGILAGIKAEGGDPNMLNATATHGAFIGQWRGSRLAALRAKYGNHPTHSQQMAFLIDEMTNPQNPEYQAERKNGFMGFANDTTADATMRDYLTSVMRPGAGLAGDLKRGAEALTEINIDTININAPHATNAKDIARNIHKALATQIATQANTGPN